MSHDALDLFAKQYHVYDKTILTHQKNTSISLLVEPKLKEPLTMRLSY